MFSEGHLQGEGQDKDAAVNVIGNYSAVTEVDKITHLYSYPMLQSFFASLSKALESHNDPFVLAIGVKSHTFVVKYDFLKKGWVLIESTEPFPRLISQENIALEVFKCLATPKILYHSPHFTQRFMYDSLQQKLCLIDVVQKTQANPNTLIFSEDEKRMLSCTGSRHVIKLHDMNFVIGMSIFTHRDTLRAVQVIHRAWQQTPEFKAIHQLTPEILAGEEDEPYNVSVFLTALCSGDTNKMHQMIDQGFQVNRFSNREGANGKPPLFLASFRGQTKEVEFLLENKADPNVADNDGGTALHMATQTGKTNVVRVLLQAHADINAAYKNNGQTPLSNAVYFGHGQVVDLLLQASAKRNISPKLFTLNNKIDSTRFSSLIDIAYQNGTMLLFIAADRGHRNVVEVLVKYGVDIDLALFFSIQFGSAEQINLLSTVKPDVEKMLLKYGSQSDLLDHYDINKSKFYQQCKIPEIKCVLEDFHRVNVAPAAVHTDAKEGHTYVPFWKEDPIKLPTRRVRHLGHQSWFKPHEEKKSNNHDKRCMQPVFKGRVGRV